MMIFFFFFLSLQNLAPHVPTHICLENEIGPFVSLDKDLCYRVLAGDLFLACTDKTMKLFQNFSLTNFSKLDRNATRDIILEVEYNKWLDSINSVPLYIFVKMAQPCFHKFLNSLCIFCWVVIVLVSFGECKYNIVVCINCTTSLPFTWKWLMFQLKASKCVMCELHPSTELLIKLLAPLKLVKDGLLWTLRYHQVLLPRH